MDKWLGEIFNFDTGYEAKLPIGIIETYGMIWTFCDGENLDPGSYSKPLQFCCCCLGFYNKSFITFRVKLSH